MPINPIPTSPNQESNTQTTPQPPTNTSKSPQPTPPVPPTTSSTTSNGIHGLSDVEMNDPNSIKVTISDADAPLVVLFGPPSCGKTMTLVRMTRFLRKEGYGVSPVRNFRPSSDTNYKDLCDTFNEIMNNDYAAGSTNLISFMLVQVMKNGRRLCQILEAPGEHYFNPQEPSANFPRYVHTIINSTNRKVWAIMVEPNWLDSTDRNNYVTRITNLKKKMRPHDNAVFVFNKIDLTEFVRTPGDVNISAAIKEIKDSYPNIFVPFQNQNPITKWFNEYNCEFVPFQTGDYPEGINGITYEEGPEEYCRKLWNTIMKSIKG